MQKLKDIIKENRLKKRLTQRELANKLNITDKQVSKWETGVSYPDITIINALSKVLDVNLAELLSAEELVKEVDSSKSINYEAVARMRIGSIISIGLLVLSIILILVTQAVSEDHRILLFVLSILLLMSSIITHLIFDVRQRLAIDHQKNQKHYLTNYYYKNMIYINSFIFLLLISFSYSLTMSFNLDVITFPSLISLITLPFIIWLNRRNAKRSRFISSYPKLDKLSFISHVVSAVLVLAGLVIKSLLPSNVDQLVIYILDTYFVTIMVLFIVTLITNIVLQFFNKYQEYFFY